jgi:hypothetical protein
MWAETQWKSVWKTLQMTPKTNTIKVQWYQVIHDLIPTNLRLHRINLPTTSQCRFCSRQDTLLHRIIECGEGPVIWRWLRHRIAVILRENTTYIPVELLLRPDFHIWPRQKHRAVLWLIAHNALYRSRRDHTLKMHDYLDFMRRAKWKIDNQSNRSRLAGNYLSVLEQGNI